MNKKQLQHQLIHKMFASSRDITFRRIIESMSKRPEVLELFYDCTPADFYTCVRQIKRNHELIPSILNCKELGARNAFKEKALEYITKKGLNGDRGVSTLAIRTYVGNGSQPQSRDLLLEMVDEKIIYKTGFTVDIRYVPYELKDDAEKAFEAHLAKKELGRQSRKPRRLPTTSTLLES